LGEHGKARCHFGLGETNEARNIIESCLKKRPEDYGGIFRSLRAMLYAKEGNVSKAEEDLAKAKEHKERFLHFHHTADQIASAYALLHKADDAIYWFKETVNDGLNNYPLFRDDPSFDSLRQNKEFNDLLRSEELRYTYFKAHFGIGSPAWERLQRRDK